MTVANVIKVVKRVVGEYGSAGISSSDDQKTMQRYFPEDEMWAIMEAAAGVWKIFSTVLAATRMRIGGVLRNGCVTVLRTLGFPDMQQLGIGHSPLEMTDRYSYTDQELERKYAHTVRRPCD